ncbi:MAG: penicillin-binding transpeptidase domain-containing protein [Flavisolibacter sp.]
MNRLLLYCFVFLFFGCTPDNVTIDDSLGKYFKDNKVEGCFGMFNNGTGEFTIYNLERYRDSAYLPASTFKIVNSLIGLQTGMIKDEKMVIPWDGVIRSFPDWNKDLSYYEAFRVSSVPYFQEVARMIGKETMQFWLDSISYGTKKITTRVDTFWLDHSLKITPDEQLGLVKNLYFKQLPFFPSNQESVKKAMLFEDKPEYRLSYKTGWASWDEQHKKHIGWVVGYIEENHHPYFFVLNLESPDKNFDMITVRMKILKDILGELGFMKGVK